MRMMIFGLKENTFLKALTCFMTDIIHRHTHTHTHTHTYIYIYIYIYIVIAIPYYLIKKQTADMQRV